MTWEEWLKLLEEQYPSKQDVYPNIWSYARSMRERNPDPGLATAEHYLWGKKRTQENPMNVLEGFLLPPAYYAAKKLGVAQGRSSPSFEQMMAGNLGYIQGLWE